MKEFIRILKTLSVLLFLIITLNTCKEKEKESFANLNSLEKIRKRGKLIAVMDFNSTNYFIYRGQPMGYQYELLQLLADQLGVKLEVKVENDVDENFNMLSKGECDIIAINLTVTKERTKVIDFTYPHSQTRQVLVQRRKGKYVTWESIGMNK